MWFVLVQEVIRVVVVCDVDDGIDSGVVFGYFIGVSWVVVDYWYSGSGGLYYARAGGCYVNFG